MSASHSGTSVVGGEDVSRVSARPDRRSSLTTKAPAGNSGGANAPNTSSNGFPGNS